MANLTTGLHFIAYQGANLMLDDASFRGSIKAVYAINQTNNGYIAYIPSSNYPAITQLEGGHLYLLDVLSEFDLPNSVELSYAYTIQEVAEVDIKQTLEGNETTSVPSVKAVKDNLDVVVTNKLLQISITQTTTRKSLLYFSKIELENHKLSLSIKSYTYKVTVESIDNPIESPLFSTNMEVNSYISSLDSTQLSTGFILTIDYTLKTGYSEGLASVLLKLL